MNLLKGLFRSRDKPQNRVGSAFSSPVRRDNIGKAVNERTAMQTTAVYACVRILAEAIAGLPLTCYDIVRMEVKKSLDFTRCTIFSMTNQTQR